MSDEDRDELIEKLRQRGRELQEKIVTEECFTFEDFLSRIDQTEDAALYLADKEGKYLYLEHDGDTYWPKFNIDLPKHFDTVTAVLKMRDIDEWLQYQFWTGCSVRWVGSDKEVSNLEALRQGRLEDVLWDARTYMTHGGF